MASALFLWRNNNPTNIGGVEVDVLVEQDFTKTTDTPQHPVESGFKISDHVIHNFAEISMVVAIGSSPVTHRHLGIGMTRTQDILSKIGTLMDRGEPIKVITSFKVYENVVITKISAPQKVEDKKGLKLVIDLKRIDVSSSQTVSIPKEYVKLLDSKNKKNESKGTRGRAGSTGSNKGSGNTKNPNKKKQDTTKKSLLKSMGDWANN